jgi:protein-tyrosine-phosphatase
MNIADMIRVWVFVLVSTSAWSNVLVHWTSSALPPAKELGLKDLVLSWNGNVSPLAKAARRQGYRVYVQVPLNQAAAAADSGAITPEGIVLSVRQSERAELEKSLPKLRSAHPKLRFVVLNPDGKRPVMRGSMVIKRGAVLEVSSPTAQPWIDTNLALVRTEQKAHQGQVPVYTFSWGELSDSEQQSATVTAADYSLAVAEAGAFHADLILELDERLQKALSEHDPEAWRLWNQVRSYVDFYSGATEAGMEAATNVAIVVDDLDPTDEVLNLLARHNLPFTVFRPPDLKLAGLESFDVVVVFEKPDREACEQIALLATHGKTVVLVDAHGSYPWQSQQAARLNEHAVAYLLGNGQVLELSEPVTDPETFAQDIRRLLGKQNALMSLWNGLTTIAVPYREHGGTVRVLELVNYAEDEPLRVQVQVKGSFASIRYETPEHSCCESLVPIKHNGFTEFVIPELRTAGRVHLEEKLAIDSRDRGAGPR